MTFCESDPPSGAQPCECEHEDGHAGPHECVCGLSWTDADTDAAQVVAAAELAAAEARNAARARTDPEFARLIERMRTRPGG